MRHKATIDNSHAMEHTVTAYRRHTRRKASAALCKKPGIREFIRLPPVFSTVGIEAAIATPEAAIAPSEVAFLGTAAGVVLDRDAFATAEVSFAGAEAAFAGGDFSVARAEAAVEGIEAQDAGVEGEVEISEAACAGAEAAIAKFGALSSEHPDGVVAIGAAERICMSRCKRVRRFRA